jgi:hypothetical protein
MIRMGFSISLIAMTTKCIMQYVTRVLTCEGPSYCTHPGPTHVEACFNMPPSCLDSVARPAPKHRKLRGSVRGRVQRSIIVFVAPTTETVGGMTDVWRQAWPPNPIGLDTRAGLHAGWTMVGTTSRPLNLVVVLVFLNDGLAEQLASFGTVRIHNHTQGVKLGSQVLDGGRQPILHCSHKARCSCVLEQNLTGGLICRYQHTPSW